MLAETFTYNDVVTWLTDGIATYCYNAKNSSGASKYSTLPSCITNGSWSTSPIIYQGHVSGKHGHQRGRCYLTSAIQPYQTDPSTKKNITEYAYNTIKTNIQNYIKKVNTSLTAEVSNEKLQKLFNLIIACCNDNIKIVSCACPAYADLYKIYFKEYPVYDPGTSDAASFTPSLVLTASQMIKSLNDFSSFYRKFATPKVIALQYSMSAHT